MRWTNMGFSFIRVSPTYEDRDHISLTGIKSPRPSRWTVPGPFVVRPLVVATFSSVTRQHVLQALAEHDARGGAEFLEVPVAICPTCSMALPATGVSGPVRRTARRPAPPYHPAVMLTISAMITVPNRYASSACRSAWRRIRHEARSVSEIAKLIPTANAR